MTVTNPVNDNIINGDGVTTVFGYTFQLPAGSVGADIYVYIIDNLGNITLLTSNYTLNLGAAQITYPVTGGIAPLAPAVNALPIGWQIAIYRIENLTQALNLATQGPFPAAGLMAALDFLTLITQQLQEQINRCVKYPIGQVPTSTDVNAFIAAVSAAIFPPLLIGTYSYLKSISNTAPTVQRFGFATDLGTVGQLMFYVGSTQIGDAGWVGPLAGG